MKIGLKIGLRYGILKSFMNLKTTSTALFEYGKYMTSTQNVQLYNFLKVLFWKYITEIVINFKGHWFDIEQNTEKNLKDFAWILPPTLKFSSRHLHIL